MPSSLMSQRRTWWLAPRTHAPCHRRPRVRAAAGGRPSWRPGTARADTLPATIPGGVRWFRCRSAEPCRTGGCRRPRPPAPRRAPPRRWWCGTGCPAGPHRNPGAGAARSSAPLLHGRVARRRLGGQGPHMLDAVVGALVGVGDLEELVDVLLPALIRRVLGELAAHGPVRSEEHTSELQSRGHLVCR